MADRETSTRKDAVPWSAFGADRHSETNYAAIFPEDAEIIRFATKFLIDACGGRQLRRSAVDVGSGANLYPALLMLPWTERVAFTEYAPANIEWLNENLADASDEWVWQPFWDLMAGLPGYRDVEQPRQRLAASHDILRLSIFDLPRHAWDLGSMFFVADSISSDEAEFESAMRSFLGALTPGAPFMMAFMEGSTGYDVSGVRFRSVKVVRESLDALLARLPVSGTAVLRTDNSVHPLRPGYDAMLLVTGHIADTGLC